MSDALPIAADSHVTIRYSIFEEGESVATSGAEDLSESYVHGYGQVFPALEKGLDGQRSGSHVSVIADPADAFGLHEEEGVFEVDKEGLEGAGDLSVGEEVVASGPEGDILMRVVEVREDSILVDTNHPLAGKRVRFEVDIVAVRPASEAEIEEAQQEMDAPDCECGESHAANEHPTTEGDEPALVQLAPRRKSEPN